MKLILLGTGNAMVTRCYNTCFALVNHGDFLLVDTGGGNGILRQLEDAKLSILHLHHLFLTHAHTDHILGAVWIIRAVASAIKKGTYNGHLTIWCHDTIHKILEPLCRALLPENLSRYLGIQILFKEIRPGDILQSLGLKLTVFDIFSTKAKQYGFNAKLPDGQRLVCLGDEPCHPNCRDIVRDCDWLLTESFCLYEDKDCFQPYEKHHSTVLDAAKMAQELNVKNLVLYHTEDKTLSTRRERYRAEALTVYSGKVFVPNDLDIISLQ